MSTTTTFVAGVAGGRVRSSETTYITARAGANLLTDAMGYVGRDVDAGTYYINDSYLSFDTSSIPDDAVVTGAVLSMCTMENASTTDLTVEARLKDWGASLGTEDFVAGADLAALPLLATLSSAGIGMEDTGVAFTSEPGFAAAINKTGYTRILLSSDGKRSVDANADSSYFRFHLSPNANPYFEPQLVVTYTFLDAMFTTILGALAALPTPVTPADIASQVICDGNSMTIGHPYDEPLPYGLGVDPTFPYPAQLQALLGSSWLVRNDGVDSQDIDNMAADAAAQIDPLLSFTRPENVVVVWEGTNEIYFHDDGAVAATKLAAYCTARRAAGFKVVILTVLPRSNFSTPVDFETQRAICNAAIRANWTDYADALADVAADSRIGDTGDEEDTNYYSDSVHMNRGGNALVAAIVYDAIKNMVTDSRVAVLNAVASADAKLNAVKLKTDTIGGAGAIEWTYTLTTPDGAPIPDAEVWVTTDEAGNNVVASGRTNAFGVVTFRLDPGGYFIWAQKSGTNFDNPDFETVTA